MGDGSVNITKESAAQYIGPMLLGLFILLHVSVSDPWSSYIGMALRHFILDVELNI